MARARIVVDVPELAGLRFLRWRLLRLSLVPSETQGGFTGAGWTPIFFMLRVPAWRVEFDVYEPSGKLVSHDEQVFTDQHPYQEFLQTGGYRPGVDRMWTWDGRNARIPGATGERVALGKYILSVHVTAWARYASALFGEDDVITAVAPANVPPGPPPGAIETADRFYEFPPLPDDDDDDSAGLNPILILVAGFVGVKLLEG